MLIKKLKRQRRIADSYKGKCLERGLSTMRLALGYTSGLPDTWISQEATSVQIPDLLPSAFPDRDIRVWGAEEVRGDFQYMGQDYVSSSECNSWLTAFVYGVNNGDGTHFVIGEPNDYGVVVIPLVISVSIERSSEL